jgi:hypothetical protein
VKRPRVIHASELAEYGYCAKSWHLRRVVGVQPQRGGGRRQHGERVHARHGLRVTAARILRAAALVALAAAALAVALTALTSG